MSNRLATVRRFRNKLTEKGFDHELVQTHKFDFVVATGAHPFTSHKLLADLRREIEFTGFDAKLHKPAKDGKVEFRIFPA